MSVTVLQPLRAVTVEPSAQNNRFIRCESATPTFRPFPRRCDLLLLQENLYVLKVEGTAAQILRLNCAAQLFLYELPDATPIFFGRTSAQDLNALKEDTGRAVIRTNSETLAESCLCQIPFLVEVGSTSLLVMFAQACQFF